MQPSIESSELPLSSSNSDKGHPILILCLFFVVVILLQVLEQLAWMQGVALWPLENEIATEWWLTSLRLTGLGLLFIMVLLAFRPIQPGVLKGEFGYPGLKYVPLSLGILVLMIAPFWLISITESATTPTNNFNDTMDFFHRHPVALNSQFWVLLDASMTIFLVPILEELVFRGAGYNFLLLKSRRTWLAIVGSTILFTVAHIPWFGDWNEGMIILLGIIAGHGLILGLIRRYSGSIYPGIVYHIGWNAWVYANSI